MGRYQPQQLVMVCTANSCRYLAGSRMQHHAACLSWQSAAKRSMQEMRSDVLLLTYSSFMSMVSEAARHYTKVEIFEHWHRLASCQQQTSWFGALSWLKHNRLAATSALLAAVPGLVGSLPSASAAAATL
jgi:hypothetical protein